MIMPTLKHTKLKRCFGDTAVGSIVGAGEKSVKGFIILTSQDVQADYFGVFVLITMRRKRRFY